MRHLGNVTIEFSGPIVIIGFGSIGKGVLPLILRHIGVPKQITIISPDATFKSLSDAQGCHQFIQIALTPENYREVLIPILDGHRGFVVNLSVNVSSVALVLLCREVGALYIDTCIEPWEGVYANPLLTPAERSNFAQRNEMLVERKPDTITALVAHGANPGLVSYLVKAALVQLAIDLDLQSPMPKSRYEWACLARNLGVKGIHISERDTQRSSIPKRKGEFVNTWSVDGFVSEGIQPSELGFGTHEKNIPVDGIRHSDSSIWLNRPGANTRVRSWTPQEGPFVGFLITHNESISISDYLSVRNESGELEYCPTCHYAYHPCDDAILSLHELVGKAYETHTQRIIEEEVISGEDELGVLLYGHAKGAMWYGSRLSIEETRALVPYQNATGLQVTSTVIGGMVWAIENPCMGIVEADEIVWQRVLNIAKPYLGHVHYEYTDWTPLVGRGVLFEEDVDESDPWQFKNVRC